MQGRHLFPRGSYRCRGAACRSGIYCHRASIDVEGRHTGQHLFPGRLSASRGGIQGRHFISRAPIGFEGRHLFPGAPIGVVGRYLFPWGAFWCRWAACKGGIYFRGSYRRRGAEYRGGIYLPGRLLASRGGTKGRMFISPGLISVSRGRIQGRHLFLSGAFQCGGAAIISPGRLSMSRGGIQGRYLFPGAPIGIERRHTRAASIFLGPYRRRGSAYKGGIYFPGRLPVSRGGTQGRHLFPKGVERRRAAAYTGGIFTRRSYRPRGVVYSGGIYSPGHL